MPLPLPLPLPLATPHLPLAIAATTTDLPQRHASTPARGARASSTHASPTSAACAGHSRGNPRDPAVDFSDLTGGAHGIQSRGVGGARDQDPRLYLRVDPVRAGVENGGSGGCGGDHTGDEICGHEGPRDPTKKGGCGAKEASTENLRGGHAGGEGKDAPVSVFPAGRIRGLGEGGSKVNRAAASPPMGVHPRRDSTERLRIVTGGVDVLPRRSALEPPWFGDRGEVPPGDHSRANKGRAVDKHPCNLGKDQLIATSMEDSLCGRPISAAEKMHSTPGSAKRRAAQDCVGIGLRACVKRTRDEALKAHSE
ncbi:uncharacterized protein [Aegilops tauschii subsp. strangulata]|uniref:uncharacterized protein isoform X1 n=1 Tax=Aegilops tauschii subsp. strangulata TaxID=200361 RepID=UPI001ABC16DE|nr:uncharacterized protein LOC120966564 isoform X1 [Aegilops tauschii subsp. strangulata]